MMGGGSTWSNAHEGYSGVGIYTRQASCAPIRAEEGLLGVLPPPGSTTAYRDLPDDQHIGGYLTEEQIDECGVDALTLDSEGRCVVLEFPAFVLFGLYCPANSAGTRDDFRYGFQSALDMRIRNITRQGKRVIVTGDLNVSLREMDTANAEESMRKEGISHEQYISTPNRRIYHHLLEGGEVFGECDEGREYPVMWDICRGFHPERRGMYTHWEQKINARPGNFGSRIDFILCSLDMKSWFVESNIQDGLMGSDHCPVYAVMQDEVELHGNTVKLLDIMNPAGYFTNGTRTKEYNERDVPVFSGKLLPAFHKRRSIRDMFGKKPPALSQSASLNVSTAEEILADGSDASKQVETKEITPPPAPPSIPADSPFSTASQATVSRSTASPAQKPATKRVASDGQPSKGTKRTKGNATSSVSSTSGKGQSSLKGFFAPKIPAPITANNGHSTTAAPVPQTLSGTLGAVGMPPLDTSTIPPPSTTASTTEPEPPMPEEEFTFPPSPTTFVDPIASKNSWSKLFSKPIAPRCEHDEPCKTMKTKKPGFNCGREFWMCVRPLGPSGAKEKGSEWRCGTFIWSSDWTGGMREREP